MEIRQLRYFVKVYETRSYTRAADELFTSRQALRHSIKTLEDELSAELFTLSGKLIIPSHAAEILYHSCQDPLAAFVKMEEELLSLHPNTSQKTRCGIVTGIRDIYTMEEFERHRQKYAKSIKFITGSCKQLRQMLNNGEIDLANILTTQPLIDEFDCTCLRNGKLYLMLHKRHPLAAKTSASISDLRGVPFITQGDEYDIHNLIESECQKQAFGLNIVFISPSTIDIMSQVNANLGVSYSVASAIYHYNAPNIVFVPFEEPHMCWYMLKISPLR